MQKLAFTRCINHLQNILNLQSKFFPKKSFLNLESTIQIYYLCGLFFKTIFINFNTLKYMSDIASRVKAIIVDKLGVDENEVTNEASFTNDLGADSLDTVELIMEFEKEFNIGIPDDQAEGIATVGAAIKFIEENAKK